MSFSSFPTHYAANISTNPVGQFAASKFAQNISTGTGQSTISAEGQLLQDLYAEEKQYCFVLEVVPSGNGWVNIISAPDGSLHYVRNDGNAFTSPAVPQPGTGNEQHQTLLTIPITVPGAKPGDAQQTVHIQVLNPNPVQQAPTKFQMGQMQLPVQNQQPGGTTVLTVAYSPQDNKFVTNHAFPDSMTVVAALQPQDLQLLAQAQLAQISANKQMPLEQPAPHSNEQYSNNDGVAIKQEPSTDWDNVTIAASQNNGNFQQNCAAQTSVPLNLQPYLKFNSVPVKYDSEIVPKTEVRQEEAVKAKRKRKVKKKIPKEKTPKPGQVLIATAADGTTLFCCPECQMAYPEKENLEQHLTVHKIERRYICDICGAGLKRKEHLERHKSGHNPDRPYICSVCLKGFKRKEHLNLHFVIHSGEKNEICGECGKGFYRKDHLRKHANSHAAKRLKEELSAKSITSGGVMNKCESMSEIVSDNCSISISLDANISNKQSENHSIS